MRRLLILFGIASTLAMAIAAETERKELIVETDWKLSGSKIDTTEKPGEGVTKMMATGQPLIIKVNPPGVDAQSLVGKADSIEYNVVRKKFILRGSASVTQVDAKGVGKSVSGTKPSTTIEIDSRNGAVRVDGPNHVKVVDPK